MYAISKNAWDISVKPGEFNPPYSKERSPFLLKIASIGFNTVGRLFPKYAAQVAYNMIFTPRKNVYNLPVPDVGMQPKGLEILTSDGTTIKARQWGESGWIVLLVHDWETDASSMYRFIKPLVRAGFRVVTFDSPAHGCSEGLNVCLPQLGQTIVDVVNHLKHVHSIIAHGIGGSSAAFGLHQINPHITLRNLILVSAPNDIEKIVHKYADMINLPANVRTEFLTKLEDIGQTKLQGFNTSFDANSQNVQRVLVVHDKDNHLYKYQEAQDIFFAWKNASILTTENLGHFGPTQHPKVVDKITEFITVGEIQE